MKLLPSIALAAVAATVPAQATAAEVRAAAATIESIDYGEVAYGRFGAVLEGGRQQPGLAAFAELAARPPSLDELDALLRDADAKVRTLAALLLFDREQKELLPRLAALAGDAARTFPEAQRNAVALIDGRRVPASPWSERPATVGAVVQQLLAFAYAFAGPRVDPDPVKALTAFRERHCGPGANAVWLALRLTRAHGGITPVRPPWHERVARVRAAVDALPSPDRELLTIGLPELTMHPTDSFATEAERIAAARKLGDEVLLLCLAGEFPSKDTGLHALFCKDGVFGTHSGLHRFVLDPRHAIFGPGAAKRLLELEAEQRRRSEGTTGFVDAGWAATAASLQPQHATAWLRAALERFAKPHELQQRAQLLAALAAYGDDASEATVVERFWHDDFVAMLGTYGRQLVLQALAGVPRTKALRVVRALLAAPAATDIDPLTAAELDQAAGALLGARPVGEDAVRQVWHPLGLQRLLTKGQREQARAQHPVETERALAAARSWRDTIAKALRED
jgi:hypothetical protein